ncbi:MAG: hypothetical protein ACMXYB_05080 [Candidatus Woesearchaeota archaeon]
MLYNYNSEQKLIGKTSEEKKRYLYLITKFFEGETLWERTKLEQEGGLIERCMGECSSEFFGDYFCLASSKNNITCPYARNRVEGGNPYQICSYFKELHEQNPRSNLVYELFQNPRRC